LSIRKIIILFSVAVALNIPNPLAAMEFKKEILQSVVSVLPNWLRWKQKNSGGRLPDAPEGTAVSILGDGYLMTNAHVLGDATEVDVRLNDGKLVAVKIIGRDLRTDLALLKAPLHFPVLNLSNDTALGEDVCAVANQFGLGLSVTCGVVSAVHRTGTGFNTIEDFVQTDAGVNPGGSGGALVDRDGNLVGMISAIFTKESDANIGINFATSSRLLVRVANDLRDHGRVNWGDPGFRVGALKVAERRKWSGAKIIHIAPGGAGEKAKLRSGDIITQIADRSIFKPTDVASALAFFAPGDEITFEFLRDDKSQQTSLTLSP
jgi:S1-C subfamily serine protease